MARQLRLVVAGVPHLVALQALTGLDPFPTADDRAQFLDTLRDAAATEGVQTHAFALLPAEARLLATPGNEQALSRCLQAVGRRYVSAYNRRHGRSGTLWSGRFRCAAVEPGAAVLVALHFVDAASPEPTLTSARHRCGGPRELWLVDPPVYWSLGNTPFERESAYARLLAEPLPDSEAARIRRCLAGGWPLGAPGFLLALEAERSRRVLPRPRGRPARRAQ